MAFCILEEIEKEKHLITAKRLAQLFGCSQKKIYAMANNKTRPSIRMEGSIKFDPKSVSFWLRKKDPTLAAAARSAA